MGILVAIASSRSEVEKGDGNRINGNVKYIYFDIYKKMKKVERGTELPALWLTSLHAQPRQLASVRCGR